MGPMNAISTATFNCKIFGFKDAESGFYFACIILSGWDVIEEYFGANVWPLSNGWNPAEIIYLTMNWASNKVPFL
jgi:hypothetical protein